MRNRLTHLLAAATFPRRSNGLALAAFLTTAMTPAALWAQENGPAAQLDDAAITSSAFADTQGRVAVNLAAGDFNQQANALAIANAPTALAGVIIGQSLGKNDLATGDGSETAASARIADGAFANAAGAISVNVAAGSENQQANAAAIATGLEGQTLAVAALEQSRAPTEPEGDAVQADAPRTAEVSATAFENASGLVQTNLTAGERNSSANSFALTLPGGAGR